MIDIAEILASLAVQRPIFHSEADFQHALAWEIQQRLPRARVRLEFPVPDLEKLIYLDIWVSQSDALRAIELKYKTRSLSVQVADERFSLKNQSAQDFARYDFVKDIQRLEQVVSSRKNAIGYAVLLTNDSSYWKPPRSRRTMDADFRLQEGRILQGTLSWDARASAGTIRGREEPLELKGVYAVRWQNYSQPNLEGDGPFRYLAMKVDKE